MASSDTAAIIGAASVATAGPLYQVFNELGLVLALMGAIGGALHALRHDVPWRAAIKPMITGAILAFGVGVISAPLLAQMLGIEVSPGSNSVPVLASGAFLIGLMQERVLARLSGGGNGQA